MTTTASANPAATTDGGGAGSIRWVITGALVTGAASAAMLTLVVAARHMTSPWHRGAAGGRAGKAESPAQVAGGSRAAAGVGESKEVR